MAHPARGRIGYWLRIGASAGLLALCLAVVDRAGLAEALAQTRPTWFIAAVALNAIGTVLIKAWVAYLTTRASGLRLGFAELVRINLIARFYTIVLPRGVSTAVRWKRYRDGGTAHAATALLLFENLISIATLFLSAALVLTFEADRVAGGIGQLLLPLSWLGVFGSAVVHLPFLHARSARLCRKLLRPLTQREGRIARALGRLLTAIEDYQALPNHRIGAIMCASLLGYIFFVLSAWALAIGMGIDVGLAAIAWVRSVTLLVALLPITVAGIGLREGAFIVLLRDYGVAGSLAFAYALASFAIQLLLGLVGAWLEAARMLRPARAEQHEAGNVPK